MSDHDDDRDPNFHNGIYGAFIAVILGIIAYAIVLGIWWFW